MFLEKGVGPLIQRIFNNKSVGNILIDKPYSFALIKLFDPDYDEFKNKELLVDGKKIRIINGS